MTTKFESKAFRAVAESESVKTTVPQAVAAVLGVEAGDSILWEIDVPSRSAKVTKGSSGPPKMGGGAGSGKSGKQHLRT
jgi:hypothetical protein